MSVALTIPGGLLGGVGFDSVALGVGVARWLAIVISNTTKETGGDVENEH